jgi:hypothetical protein
MIRKRHCSISYHAVFILVILNSHQVRESPLTIPDKYYLTKVVVE